MPVYTKGPWTFIQLRNKAYFKVYDEIIDAIAEADKNDLKYLIVSRYSPRTLKSIVEEFQSAGYDANVGMLQGYAKPVLFLAWE